MTAGNSSMQKPAFAQGIPEPARGVPARAMAAPPPIVDSRQSLCGRERAGCNHSLAEHPG